MAITSAHSHDDFIGIYCYRSVQRKKDNMSFLLLRFYFFQKQEIKT